MRMRFVLMVCLVAAEARADVDPNSGIDFVVIGAVGNRGYDGPDPENRAIGRGSVGYEYGIGRFEVTTAQWMEFYNTFRARPDPVSAAILPNPIIWGAGVDPTYTGPGTRWRLGSNPDAGMIPTGGITWRVAAMYCNWLHNGKSNDLSAIMNGAYDVSTFGETSPLRFTDQRTHNPDARYWIPTLDEWMKAAFYDPNGNGEGQDRWWEWAMMSDSPPTYGPPGEGQANANWHTGPGDEFAVPLGAYPTSLSPWGLLDAAGATREWTEEFISLASADYRRTFGSGWSGGTDIAWSGAAEYPISRDSGIGFRIASSVPSPGTSALLLLSTVYFTRRRRTYANARGVGGRYRPARHPDPNSADNKNQRQHADGEVREVWR